MRSAGFKTECVADRAVQGARDTGPSASFSGIAAHAYAAATPTPCGQGSLTRSRAAGTPIRATVCLVAGTRRRGSREEIQGRANPASRKQETELSLLFGV